jgi:predicted RNA binding protein YcfA (HicA-like mRNA interferase family)
VGERFPTVTSKQLVKVLKAHCFEEVRQTGSHLSCDTPTGAGRQSRCTPEMSVAD